MTSLSIENPSRRVSEGKQLDVVTDIYQQHTNMVIWQRELADELKGAAEALIEQDPTLQTSMIVSPETAEAEVQRALRATPAAEVLSKDIAQLVDMFCSLFELSHVGLRLAALNRAMCPRFHVDRVPCRLITTYKGIATE